MIYPTIHFNVVRSRQGAINKVTVATGTFQLMHSKDTGGTFIGMLKQQFPEAPKKGNAMFQGETHEFEFWREEKQDNKKIPW